MPLSAIVDGDLVCAPLLPDARWQQLRGGRVELQPCGHRGFPRVSPLGTRHFVHERDSDCHHSESPEHLHLKAVVARAVAAAGWQAGTEVPGDGFIADVLACRGGRRVALEVQRSRQVLQQYRARQDTYARAGVRAVWLANSVPSGHLDDPELPLFLVTDWVGEEARCVVAGRTLPVPHLVMALLNGACRWRPEVATAQETIAWVRTVCPVCGARRAVVVDRWVEGRCRCGLPVVVHDPCRRGTQPRCCGYWGAALGVRVGRTARAVRGVVAQGHWCLSV